VTDDAREASEVSAALAQVARIGIEAARLAAAEGPGAELARVDGMPAEQAKSVMAAALRDAAQKAAELRAAQQRARDAIEEQRRQLDAQLAAMTAALGPLQEQAGLLQEGIWSINLYLGVGEGIVALADGEPAPAGTPIHVRQGVLAMDEESAIAAEDGGIDHMQVDEFDAWITASQDHIDQLIPEPRGVVAIMPRRSAKDYGDAWSNTARNAENHATYLLIRNGGCLYRYIAQGFSAGPRLTPLRDEFTRLFTERRWDPAAGESRMVALQPGTPGWARAERAASARERHFYRVALILQGLVDRTAVFHPLPVPQLSLLHPQAYDDGHVVLVSDEELALTSRRQPFRKWLAGLNAQLRPGMRVVGNFRSEAWRNANECYDGDRPRYDRHSRVHPRNASHPVSGAVYTIDRREGDWLVLAYDRTDEVWRRDVPVPDSPGRVYSGLFPAPPRQRATVRISPADTFIIPVDLVTAAQCEEYLRSRTDRHLYVEMFPVLKAAIAARRAEAAAEEPMRQLLAGHIAAEHGVDIADAEAAVPDLVDWWKLANRHHRPLVTGTDPQAEARAVTAISREFAARRAAAADDAEPATVARLRELVPEAMLVARRRDGSWLVLEPQPREVPGQPSNAWAREHAWPATLAGAHRIRDWVMPGPSRTARWRILWASPAWAAWDTAATPATHLTDPEIGDMVAEALAAAAGQAASPRQPYRAARAEDPLGGQPAAVAWQPDARSGGMKVTVYWLCGRRCRDHYGDGVPGAELGLTWKRTTGGRVATKAGRLQPRVWTQPPWPQRAPLLRQDPLGMPAVTRALDDYRASQEAEIAAWRRAASLTAAITRQWSDAARETARRKFITDYGDETLWADHSAALRFDCPHTGYRGHELPWEQAVIRLVRDGATLTGITVAEMASLHAARYGDAVDVPEDIAGYQFPDGGS
jgi:hypothetical protein